MLYRAQEEIEELTKADEGSSEISYSSDELLDTEGCREIVDQLGEGNVSWPNTAPNQWVTLPCPAPIKPELGLSVSRQCYSNGTWSLSDYNECISYLSVIRENFHNIAIIQFGGSLTSLALLCFTLYIFSSFRSIQCSRLSVHKNLVVAFILYYIVNIVFWEPQLHGNLKRTTAWINNGLKSLILFTKMSSTNWLFNEGFYLHSRITTSIFDSEAPFLFFHSVGWGLSGFCVFIWTVVMLCTNKWDVQWQIQNEYIWIIAGPMAFVLILNLVFLINIVRILVTKLRANSTPEADQISPVNYLTGLQIARPKSARGRFVFPHGTDRMTALFWWKAMKAVGVLFGFLGLSNFIFFYNHKDGGFWEAAYLYTNSILQSSQGIVVSVLYCFCSPDVRLAMAKRLYRMKVRWHSRNLRRDNNRRFRESRRGLSETSLKFRRNTLAAANNEPDANNIGNQMDEIRHQPHRWPPLSNQDIIRGRQSSNAGTYQPPATRSQGIHHLQINSGEASNNEAANVEANKSNNGHLTLKVWIHPQPANSETSKAEEVENGIQECCL